MKYINIINQISKQINNIPKLSKELDNNENNITNKNNNRNQYFEKCMKYKELLSREKNEYVIAEYY